MRVLIVHSRYLSGTTSGENRVVEDEARLLAEGGHEVVVWSPSPEVDGRSSRARAGLSAVWSRGAVENVRGLIREHRSEVVHLHNPFPSLSPAVIRAAAAEGPAVLMSLHNYRLMCLPATLLRDGSPCLDCVGKVPWRGVVRRCYRGSVAASGALAASLSAHRALGTFGRVDRFLAVSGFLRDRHVEAGLPAERVIVKPNFARGQIPRVGPGEDFVYVGRLSPEKGLAGLLSAWRHVPGQLLVAGDGPQADELRRIAPPGVRFLGRLGPEEVPALVRGARALVYPSVTFEGSPRGILEAYAAGVPVVASRIGSLPEHVEEGRSGLLVPPEDPQGWARAVARLEDDAESVRMGRAAHALWRTRYSPGPALEALVAAYRAASPASLKGVARPAEALTERATQGGSA